METNKQMPLIELRKVKKFFPLKKNSLLSRKQLFIRANEDVSFTINKGETFGLVGESGCGKSTLGRVILQLYPQTSGSVLYYGIPLRELNPKYVLKEIKKLPAYQQKARSAYEKAVALDHMIEELKKQIPMANSINATTANSSKMKAAMERYQALQEQANHCRTEAISQLNATNDEESNPDDLIREVIRMLESDEDLQHAFDALYRLPSTKNVKAALRELKPIININLKTAEAKQELDNINSNAALHKKITNYEYKSKEFKKEASRQLREGSKTAGDLILEKDIAAISSLMYEEELNHRAAKNIELQLKGLNRNASIGAETLKTRKMELLQEQTRLESKSKELQGKIEKYHRSNVQPITERCLNVEYQDKMQHNKEYGINLNRLDKEEMRRLRKRLQIVFQDPYSSLDPRMTVGQIIEEAVVEHGLYRRNSPELENYVIEIMKKCGLDHYMIHRYPHQFSGGQRQRIGIARALALQPEFVVCDESVSALDVSIQSQILNLLDDLKKEQGLTYLFISHALSVIKHVSDRIGVMYLGNIVELCDADELYNNPLHPYSKALISSIPTTEKKESERIILEGDIPSNIVPPSGCKFRTRCPLARDFCSKKVPEYREVAPGHFVACHFYEETKNLK